MTGTRLVCPSAREIKRKESGEKQLRMLSSLLGNDTRFRYWILRIVQYYTGDIYSLE